MRDDVRDSPTTSPGRTADPLDLAAPATTGNATVLRRRFRAWAGAVLPRPLAADLTLAVYEALANAVEHAFVTHEHAGTMRLVASVIDDDVEVVVTDDGRWLAPSDAGSRGQGTALMHRLTTAVQVGTGAAGTTVRLTQRLPGR